MAVGELVLGVVGTLVVLGVLFTVIGAQLHAVKRRAADSNPRP